MLVKANVLCKKKSFFLPITPHYDIIGNAFRALRHKTLNYKLSAFPVLIFLSILFFFKNQVIRSTQEPRKRGEGVHLPPPNKWKIVNDIY
jgi:hypothetical protein